MEVSIDDHVMQMFEFHMRGGFINLYVGPMHANGNHDGVTIDNHNAGNENSKKVMNRKIGNKPRNDNEMGADCDDEFYSRMVTDEQENDSENIGVLSRYESNNYAETKNDSDSDFENYIIGFCLNVDEFSTKKGEILVVLRDDIC
ncbi:hypothetical protein ACH5RR_029254 [Cinchona calisaya]|uniref:Uncharacterized protein n=1 Tax=Cinchona calisaya TaxID=153742 RepID=A0ABD2YWC8_9GENT